MSYSWAQGNGPVRGATCRRPRTSTTWCAPLRTRRPEGSWVSPQIALALLTERAYDRPALSAQETLVLSLYAAGLPLKTVARQIGITQDTAKQYLDRVRAKYRRAGRASGTKIDLYPRAIEDGYLPGETISR